LVKTYVHFSFTLQVRNSKKRQNLLKLKVASTNLGGQLLPNHPPTNLNNKCNYLLQSLIILRSPASLTIESHQELV